MAKILVVEDDELWSSTIVDTFELDQFEIEAVFTGQEGYDRLRLYYYDLVILDWGLPDFTGVRLLQRYREFGGKTPVLMLTSMDSLDDKERGLDSGADDYLTKPFEMRELRARVRALLRRQPDYKESRLTFASLILDPKALTVHVQNTEIDLLPREFMLLQFLMRFPGQVFSAEQLLNRVWPTESDATEVALRSCLARLRKKIEIPESGCVIQNTYGIGYSLAKSGK